MSSVAQMLRQAEALKASVSDSSKTISETWVTRQKLEDVYKKILLTDLEYALDKKVEQELWNHAFKNQINNLQTQAKDKQNVKRAEIQATLNLFLETASGFYLQFLQILCTTFKLDLPFRRKSSFYGVMKERSTLKLKVTPPKKSSCLYVCQHCLVHLGDIARYRQQIDQAQSYYWHAAYLVPFNGQPYNQLAILEAAKGNKLSTVFYYIRSLAVKVPFPVAATNLEKLYAKLTKETPDFKGKLSASEMITGFLQFHALVHLCTDLIKAAELSDKLAAGLPSHVTSQSFPWQVLVHIVAINIFAMNHVHHVSDTSESGMTNGDSELTDDEEKCFSLVFTLTVNMVDILLQYTPKQEHKVCEYFTLPAVKLLLDWLKLNPSNFEHPVLRNSSLWGNLCKVLNSIQSWLSKDGDKDIAKYEDCPLPEDSELRCFHPIEKAQSGWSYSKLPADGLPADIEVRLRCQRLVEHGHWIKEEQPGVQLSIQRGSAGLIQFTSPNQPTQNKVVKTVTLSVPSSSSNTTTSISTASPERKSNRHNVAIQAIMQKQAENSGKSVKIKEEPASPKYLLGVPTSEPVFFKTGGQRQTGQVTVSQSTQSSPSPTKPSGHTGGVLVIKNQEVLSQTSSRPSNQSKSWQQQRQGSAGSSSWQQQQLAKPCEKTGWPNLQQPPSQQVQGQSQNQPSPWQQQNSLARPQLSPQTSQGQWQFPGQPNFPSGRNPMSMQHAPGNRGPPLNINSTGHSPQTGFFPPSQPRQAFPPGGQSSPQAGVQVPFGNEPSFKNSGAMMFNRQMDGGQAGQTMQNSSTLDRFPGPHMGSGDGTSLPFGPKFPSMFRHPPPPSRFPLPPNFQAPPPDHNLQTNQSVDSSSQVAGIGNSSSFLGNQTNIHNNQNNFAHAPGTERPQGQRLSAQSERPLGQRGSGQQPMPPNLQMPFSQNQFMSPFPGFMGFPGMSNNQMKSPLESLFGKPRFPQDEIPPNMADIISTLSKMAVQPPRENVLPPQRTGPSSFQGHAEGTPKPESYYSPQRSTTVPAVNIDVDVKPVENTVSMPQPPQQQQQQQPSGTYSLFSGSPWLSSGDTKSIGSSPFSSESSSMRNSPDPSSDSYLGDVKAGGQGMDLGLRFSGADERATKQGEHSQQGPYFQNNVQSIWSNQTQSPLERLLELQKQQRQTEPH